ncbi:adenylyl-sulfate kinase [Algisphaera agarilytica]|uniref:Adenylyl-sulfate kinase n=1 Tax=Algisphaera agarilytica TaxID=1385975 RepID=A0A7X0LKL0_9BACT|nr:adenylyl-sulfate kinase [Algisphaera agarilytica]MBB6429959.1 adenylylsulfate kinase [Algisphaera agarilytica]
MSDNSPTSTNITWHAGQVSPEARQANMGQRGATVWFTGLSGSGKSTVAVAVEKLLIEQGRHVYRLDGDNVRYGLCSNLGFSPEDRDENIRRIGEVAKLFADSGMICLCSFVSPYREARQLVRGLHESAEPKLSFLEAFVDVPVEVAESRDPKGLYKKARAGEIKDFTGISAPFEAPESPEIHLKTHEMPLEDSAAAVVEALKAHGVI